MTDSHYLKPLIQNRWPHRYVYLDSEAYRVPDDDNGETQFFRLAVAQFEHNGILSEPQRFEDTLALWHYIDTCTSTGEQTVVLAHNIGYDLRLCKGLFDLPELGWEFEVIRLGNSLGWAKAINRRHKTTKSLLFVDLLTWLPMPLKNVAALLDVHKEELPDDDDDQETWFKRCETDVAILRDGWRVYRRWAYPLVPFRQTGASSGWALFKYRFLQVASPILAHGDDQLRERERVAAYAGRAELYRPGRHIDVYEYDYTHAYVSACVDLCVPTVHLKTQAPRIRSLRDVKSVLLDDQTALVTAAVHVPLGRLPVLPYRSDDRVVWPVGDFTGTWWLTELDAAVERGTEVRQISDVQFYRTAPALDAWARWMIERIETDPEPVVRAVCKQWARTLIGRFGMRYPLYIRAGKVADPDLWAGYWLDGENLDQPARQCMMIGQRIFVQDRTEEGRDTVPQIMGFVMAETRLRLLRAIEQAGFENVIYADTDGLMVSPAGHENLAGAIDGLRLKHRWRVVDALGPKQLFTDGEARVAGLPSRAQKRNRDGSYDVEVWEGMGHALETGQADRVRVSRASVHVTGRDGRRQHVGGVTLPLVVTE